MITKHGWQICNDVDLDENPGDRDGWVPVGVQPKPSDGRSGCLEHVWFCRRENPNERPATCYCGDPSLVTVDKASIEHASDMVRDSINYTPKGSAFPAMTRLRLADEIDPRVEKE